MAPAADVDVLFDVKNNYYLGAYQQCINEAQSARVKSDEDKTTRDTFLYRAYIALNKPSIPLSEIKASSTSVALKAVRRFADYIANPNKRRKIVEEVDAEMNSNLEEDDTNYLITGLIFMHENDIDNALRVLHLSDSLECQAATIQCLLKIHRVDLAIKEIKKMQEVDEDATITQLALAWVNTAAGKEKLKDAFYIYQEMIDKYGATPTLQVSQASCLILQGKYEDADKLLQEAQQRDANNPDILINLLVNTQFLDKGTEVINRYINQIKSDHPNHPWTIDFLNKEKAFDRICQESSA
uniref:Coatomer subunit epsilon n=1 Tax=Acrobeloides nanus TaxID=290746 RepID=A0A914DTN2_9BILA